MIFHLAGMTFAHADGVTVAVIPDWALLLDVLFYIGIVATIRATRYLRRSA